MATKSNRSSGTQFNNRGVSQGTTLVGQGSGLPIDEMVDTNGVRRLAVDAAITLDAVTIDVDDLTPDKDQVSIGDPVTGAHIRVEANGSINANVEVSAADGDNIAISDGTDTLAINPDGSINVNVTTSNTGVVKSLYNEITAVGTSVLTTIDTYTAPVGKVTYLQKVETSGTNIAEYTIEINSVVKNKKRTYFGNSLNAEFIYAQSGTGLPLNVGDIITVRVIHSRPMIGNFNSEIQVIEI